MQPDRVMEFCNNNDLQLIVRAHECVMDGFERFAQGHLITLFSATNYCGMFPGSALSSMWLWNATWSFSLCGFCSGILLQVRQIMLGQS